MIRKNVCVCVCLCVCVCVCVRAWKKGLCDCKRRGRWGKVWKEGVGVIYVRCALPCACVCVCVCLCVCVCMRVCGWLWLCFMAAGVWQHVVCIWNMLLLPRPCNFIWAGHCVCVCVCVCAHLCVIGDLYYCRFKHLVFCCFKTHQAHTLLFVSKLNACP